VYITPLFLGTEGSDFYWGEKEKTLWKTMEMTWGEKEQCSSIKSRKNFRLETVWT
jgi:hypothetical protein